MAIKDMSTLDIQIRLLDVIEEREATAFKLKETNNGEEAMKKYRKLDKEMNDLIKALANGQASKTVTKLESKEEKQHDDISQEKRAWLKSIGAGEFPLAVKFIYDFNGVFNTDINTNHFLDVEYIKNTALEDLQAQYEENKKEFKKIYVKKA